MAQLDLLISPSQPQFPPLPVPAEPSLPAKSDDAYRTISEVADVIGVPQHVLRFWESNFPQLKPSRMRGARRYYRPEDVALLKTIKSLLYDKGYTIKGAKQVVRSAGAGEAVSSSRVPPASASPVKLASSKPVLDKTALVSELRVLKSMLKSLL